MPQETVPLARWLLGKVLVGKVRGPLLGNPDAVTLSQIRDAAITNTDFCSWISDRKNRRVIPHRLEQCGYTPVRSDAADDGLWKLSGKRQVVYARDSLSARDRLRAANRLSGQSGR